MISEADKVELDKVIVGRVVPHIYAFRTGTFPEYLKVGDTYRPVEKRLEEWGVRFPGLNEVFRGEAVIDGTDIYFRDFSVHQCLEDEGFERLDKSVAVERNAYYSKEFFEGVTRKDVEKAVATVKDDFREGSGKFLFYRVSEIDKADSADAEEREPVDLHLRKEQQDAVLAFSNATKKLKRSNLLMYAVMRFGKTVTALSCAKEMNAKFVVVVTGKTDVEREWRNTVRDFTDFKDYTFVGRKELNDNWDYVTNLLKSGKRVVLFDSLQDFCDKNGKVEIKHKHKQIFKEKIDLLIIDETHFAARAENCGKVLRDGKLEDCWSDDASDETAEDSADATLKAIEQEKVFDAKVKLHLSGTPYRILMGSEFDKKDVICFCQFSDIIDAQRKWDDENLGKDGVEEWENPYFGFPQMVRFAFNLNESARRKLEDLENAGVSCKFGELFSPKNMRPDKKGNHRKFVHETEVVELLQAIGGSKEDGAILPFLNYERIRNRGMCRHLVFVLPCRSACDAVETLLSKRNRKYRGKFGRLEEYKVFNIAGHDCGKGLKQAEGVVRVLAEADARGEKTITLTVDRMLTGTTVPQWDTMLFLRDVSSPQMYDQAIFRLQSSLIRERKDERGGVVRENMKPQTILVDFDPKRLFRLQEQRAQIYNVNTGSKGNTELEARLTKELEISPVVRFDENGIHRVTPNDVMSAVCEYSSKRGVAEEVAEIPVDNGELANAAIREVIEKLPELGSIQGLTIDPHEGPQTDPGLLGGDTTGPEQGKRNSNETKPLPDEQDAAYKFLVKKLQTYRSLILFFSFLSADRVKSLDEIIACVDKGEDNRRIASHLGLEKQLLEIYKKVISWNTLMMLDRKIRNLDWLANETEDIDLGPEYKHAPKEVKKAIVAMRKFGRLGEAKIVTPPEVAYDMVNQISPEDLKGIVTRGEKILDPASIMGEFAIAVVRRCSESDIGLGVDKLQKTLYAIPMCGLTYEFTRKVYQFLGLDVSCIATPELLNSENVLIKKADGSCYDYDRICKMLCQGKPFNRVAATDNVSGNGGKKVKFSAVIGNPPYQEGDGGHGRSAKSIYPDFVELAKKISSRFVSLIIPARWYSGGKGLDGFRSTMLNDKSIVKLADYESYEDVFEDQVDLSGGVCYFLRDADTVSDKCEISNHARNKETVSSKRPLNQFETFIRQGAAVSIVKRVRKVHGADAKYLSARISPRKPFGLVTNYEPKKRGVPCWFKQKIGLKYADKKDVKDTLGVLKKWKLLIPRSPIAGQTDFTKPVGFYYEGNVRIAKPGECCTEKWLVAGAFDTRAEAVSYKSYLFTKIVRFLLLQTVVSQDVTRENYMFVPDVGEYNKTWTDDLLRKRWGITDEEWNFIDSRITAVDQIGKRR